MLRVNLRLQRISNNTLALSRVRDHDKLRIVALVGHAHGSPSVHTHQLLVEDRGVLQWLWRAWTNDGYLQVMQFINVLLDAVGQELEQVRANKHQNAAYEMDYTSVLDHLLEFVYTAITALETLGRSTYAANPSALAEVEVVLLRAKLLHAQLLSEA